MAFITTDDITDSIVVDFDIDDYITLADNPIISLARKFGVMSEDDIEDDPFDEILKEYEVAWLLERFCRDTSGQNDTDLSSNEKYMYKHDIYSKRRYQLYKELTVEMFLGTVDRAINTAPSSPMIYRG